jgi:hypothetical protein
MILATVNSVNGVPIRLTEERWDHIIDRRPDMRPYFDEVLGAVEEPMFILRGRAGALIGVTSLGRKRYLHVFYKEVSRSDGFIITAYIDDTYNRKQIIWRADKQ